MEISKHIINEAREILKAGKELPHKITSAPHFYVTEASDKSIQAFSSVDYEGTNYKIGTKK